MAHIQRSAGSALELLEPGVLEGLVMIVGAADTGKSTLARELYRRLAGAGRHVAFLDGDPGQSGLGPPATLSLAIGTPGDASFPPAGPVLRRFAGSVSPRRHMLPLLAGAAHLVNTAQAAGVETVLFDTTGLVSAEHGGLALKRAKIELLRPSTLIAIQRGGELSSLLAWAGGRPGMRVISLPPASATRHRDPEERRAHRARQFAEYFAGARPAALELARYLIWPTPSFVLHQLVALENAEGLALGLGIVLAADLAAERLVVLTPLATMAGVQAVHLGDLIVDPKTYHDSALMAR